MNEKIRHNAVVELLKKTVELNLNNLDIFDKKKKSRLY